MARTHRHLWPQIVGWENLLASYFRCRRRKRFKRGAVEFDFRAMDNLLESQRLLRSARWQPGAYRQFQITDPKPRTISAAPFADRVVHHAIVRVLEPLFDKRFIDDSYACRRGKGTHRAIRRAQYFLRRFPWYLKTDIVKFFPSIDHTLLLECLSRVVVDEEVQRLIGKILASGSVLSEQKTGPVWFPGDDLLDALRPRGLPIGNLTSQFFANVFLDPIDHYIKEDLRVPGYVRYADDLFLFGHSKQELRLVERRLRERLAEQRLKLHDNKTHVCPSAKGVGYLGLRVWSDSKKLSTQAIRRFQRRRRRMEYQFLQAEKTCFNVEASLRCWLNWAEQCNSFAIKKTLIGKVRLRRGTGQMQKKSRRRRGGSDLDI